MTPEGAVVKKIRLPDWDAVATPDDRVLVVLAHARGGRSMTQDEITAVIALWKSASISVAMATLVLEGKLTAGFTGGEDDNAEDDSQYEFRLTDEGHFDVMAAGAPSEPTRKDRT